VWTSLGLQYFVTTVAAATATATATATSLCSSSIRLAVRLATAATASDGQQVSSLSPGQTLATSAMPVTATAATTTTGMAMSPVKERCRAVHATKPTPLRMRKHLRRKICCSAFFSINLLPNFCLPRFVREIERRGGHWRKPYKRNYYCDCSGASFVVGGTREP